MKMPNKNHKNVVEWHKLKLEEDFNYRCKKEFDIIRNSNIHKLDLACACKDKPPVAVEIESQTNFQTPQIQSNSEDLREFKRIFPEAKTFHIHISETIDFEKEFGDVMEKTDLKSDVNEVKMHSKINPFSLGPFQLKKSKKLNI